jgi:hypothetical protein
VVVVEDAAWGLLRGGVLVLLLMVVLVLLGMRVRVGHVLLLLLLGRRKRTRRLCKVVVVGEGMRAPSAGPAHAGSSARPERKGKETPRSIPAHTKL